MFTRPEYGRLVAGAGLGAGQGAGLGRQLDLLQFSRELRASVSCLTAVPDQFYDLDILGSNKAVRELSDRVEDIIDIVRN